MLCKAGVVVLLFQHRNSLFDRGDVIFGQCLGVRTWVGQYFVFFIQSLCQTKGVFGAKTKAGIGFTLQTGQVKQGGRCLCGGFGFLGDRAFLSFAGHDNGGGGDFTPQASVATLGVGVVFLEFWIVPTAFVHPLGANKLGMHFPVIA